jgi:hypothetical protein
VRKILRPADKSNGIGFLIAAVVFVVPFVAILIINSFRYKLSVTELVLGKDTYLHMFVLEEYLRSVVYGWLLSLAIFPLVFYYRNSIKNLIWIVLSLHFLMGIDVIFRYPQLSVVYSVLTSVTAVFFHLLVFGTIWLFSIFWAAGGAKEFSLDDGRLRPTWLWIKRYILSFSVPVMILLIPVALIVLYGSFTSSQALYYLFPVVSAVSYFWRVLIVLPLGLVIASHFCFWIWRKYFAIVCGTLPIISELPMIFWPGQSGGPEYKMFAYSFVLVTLLAFLWFLAFKRWTGATLVQETLK